ncbi:mucin-associated surface protein (MASP), partial [Trypanosoma cruzi]
GVIPHRCAAGPPVDRRGLSGLVRVAVAEWPKGYGCHWSLRSCAVRFFLVDTLDIFGSDLRVRHFLEIRWSCRRIRMRGLLQRLECQSGHVGRVTPYCGRTRRLCHRLGRATLTCCSSFYEEVPWTRQVEVPEAVGAVRLLSVGGAAPPT